MACVVGCADKPDDTDVVDETSVVPEATEIEAALEAFAAWVPIFGDEPVTKVASDFRTLGSNSCPEIVVLEEEIGWIGDCGAQDVWFSGGGLERQSGFDQFAEASRFFRDTWGPQLSSAWSGSVPELQGMTLNSNAYVQFEDGSERALGGQYAFVHGEVDGVTFRTRQVGGTVLDDAPMGGEHDWVAAGLRAIIDVDEGLGPNGFVRRINGVFSGFDVGWSTVDAVDVLVSPDGCQDEPTGELFLRHPAGGWVSVRFDPEENCDGCGELRYDGDVVAAVCPDLTALWQPMEDR